MSGVARPAEFLPAGAERNDTAAMLSSVTWRDARRTAPRVDVATACLEVTDWGEREVLAVDLSAEGIRIERPYRGGPTPGEIYLEIVIPELEEIIVARARACFDRLRIARFGPGFVRTTGFQIVAATPRDRRVLDEFVGDTHRAYAWH